MGESDPSCQHPHKGAVVRSARGSKFHISRSARMAAMAATGTTRTSRSSPDMSVHWGGADSPPMMLLGPFMTRSGSHRVAGIRRTGVTEYLGRGRADHSALMLAARITLPHFSVSSAMSLPKSAGEPASTVPPKSANPRLHFGIGKAGIDLLLSLSNDRQSAYSWRAESEPRRCLVARHEFAKSRNVRQNIGTRRRR